jgi:hypothetical protein
MAASRPARLRSVTRAVRRLLIPTSQPPLPATELDPARVRVLAETAAEVRFAAISLPPKERKTLVDGRNSIISSRLRAEAQAGESRQAR